MKFLEKSYACINLVLILNEKCQIFPMISLTNQFPRLKLNSAMSSIEKKSQTRA